MQDVYVVGAAMTPFGKYQQSSYVGIAVPAVVQAIETSRIAPSEIGAVYCGHAYGGMLTAQRICKEMGLGGIPMINVDNACSGGATALYEAIRAIRHGDVASALVIGVDKLTQFHGGPLPLPAEDREVRRGLVMPAVYAVRARRYLAETGATIEDLAEVTVKAHDHGALSPYAQMRNKLTVAEVLAARPIADPLTLLMCCPTGDGAAALVVTSSEVFRRKALSGIRVRASVLHSGRAEEGTHDMVQDQITEETSREAYQLAQVDPQDLDVVELHDAFTIAEPVYYESLSLAARGHGYELIRSGATRLGGKIVVNPGGGLMARGHPVGATGVAQVAEAFWQLTASAGKRQVEGARLALTHVTGGGVSGMLHGACAVHIFERA